MIEVLLLLAAASPGGPSDTNLNPAIAPTVIAEAPGNEPPHDADSGAQSPRPWLSDDADLNAILSKVSDVYDVAPVAASPKTPVRPPLGPHLTHSNERYKSQGRDILIEVLRPDDDRQRAAVLILHGASGIGDGTFYHAAAEIFAEHGYVTFLPHYLPGTDRRQAHTPRPVPGQDNVRAGFPSQERILQDGIEYIARSRYVDAGRIGVFGLSLGGFHALTLSSRDHRIAAVVDMSGALRGNMMPESNRLAPTLALHGARDSTVPVARARALAEQLRQHRIPHQLVVYPDQGHFFRGRAQEDALERSADFLGTYLHPSETRRAARSHDGAE